MMGLKSNDERNQTVIISLEDLVPPNHLVRKIDAAMDFSFIYDEVKDLYKPYGRESSWFSMSLRTEVSKTS